MKIVAVTGGIGSGKSTVSDEFKNLGATVISADKISHKIMEKGGTAYKKVLLEFGEDILDKDEEINRKALAKIVFSDNKKLEKLNDITHCLIYCEMKNMINHTETEVVCLEIPLLFDAPCPIKINISVAVIADYEKRIQRVINRDRCTQDAAIARMNKQKTDEELKQYADCVIENNGNISELKSKVKKIYDKLVKTADN